MNNSAPKAWQPLINKTLEKLKKIHPDVENWVSFKQKWGFLCINIYPFDTPYRTEEFWDIIREAEEESSKICEFCGSTDNPKLVTTEKAPLYIVNLCVSCQAIHKAKESNHSMYIPFPR